MSEGEWRHTAALPPAPRRARLLSQSAALRPAFAALGAEASHRQACVFTSQLPPASGQAAALQALPTDWLIYDEMTRAHRIASIRCCSVVTPVTLAVFGGCGKLPSTALQEPAAKSTTVNILTSANTFYTFCRNPLTLVNNC